MEENSSAIYQTLITDGGHLYICGDAGMAADVTKTLSKILQKEEKKKNPEIILDALNVSSNSEYCRNYFISNDYFSKYCFTTLGYLLRIWRCW